jgi:hypothetical protein
VTPGQDRGAIGLSALYGSDGSQQGRTSIAFFTHASLSHNEAEHTAGLGISQQPADVLRICWAAKR